MLRPAPDLPRQPGGRDDRRTRGRDARTPWPGVVVMRIRGRLDPQPFWHALNFLRECVGRAVCREYHQLQRYGAHPAELQDLAWTTYASNVYRDEQEEVSR